MSDSVLTAPLYTVSNVSYSNYGGTLTARGTVQPLVGPAVPLGTFSDFWYQKYSFTQVSTVGQTFVKDTRYPIATFTLPAEVPNVYAVRIVDWANNRIGGVTPGPVNGDTYAAINAMPLAALPNDAGIFEKAVATNAYPQDTVKNATSSASSSSLPLLWDLPLPLPVKLTNFSAKATADCKAELSWSSSTEINSAYYEIQHSTDGRVFTNAGKVTSNNNAIGSNYRFTFNGTANGLNIFRLRMVDKDGSSEFSTLATVKSNCDGLGIVITGYPNPVVDNFTITGLKAGQRLMLYNAIGQQLSQVIVMASVHNLGMSKFTAGIYMLVVLDADGKKVTSLKVVKQG